MTAVEFESRRRMMIRRVLTTLVIIGCAGLLIIAAQRTERGDKDEPKFTGEATATADVVELQAPEPGTNVLAQAQVLLDLNIRYDATLSINNVEIPSDQLQKSRELATVSFTPGPGKVFERLPAGRVCAVAQVFRVDGTQEDPRSVSWCFNVT